MDHRNDFRYHKMGILSQSRILIVLFCFLGLAAFAVWAPKVEARSNFYSDRGCASCHGSAQTTCNGCHHHGPSGLSATTNKTTYAPGEALSVTFSGGRSSGATVRGGWIRAILYLDNQEVARSTGPVGEGGGESFPITFSTTAPNSAGTYTFQAAWFGNTNDNGDTHGEQRVTSNSFTVSAPTPAGALSVSSGSLSSSGTAGGPFSPVSQSFTLSNTGGQSINWTAAETLSWVTLSSTGGSLAVGANTTVTVSINNNANSLAAGSYSGTVTFTNTTNGTGNATRSVSLAVSAPAGVLTGLTIGSPSTVPENSSASYTAMASWSDGSTSDVTASAGWSVDPTAYASISAGVLETSEVPGDQTVTVSASYSSGVVTETADIIVTIVDVPGDDPPPPTGVSTMPENGAIDVPVTAVVTFTGDGSAKISTVVNERTFTLMEDSPVAITSRDDDENHSQCVTEGIVNGSFTYTGRKVAIFTPLCTLKEITTYTATITPPAGVQQSVLAGPMSWSFITIAMTPDSDDDGDPDAGDEFPHDCRNATPGIPKGKGKIKMNLDGPPNGCFKKIKATSETDPFVNPTGMPSGYEFRDGIIAYEIVGISTGETDTVTLTYPEAFPAGSKVYKVDSSGFYEYPDAVIDGSTVTLTLTDGGSGDSDLQVNGVIVDPIGVAVPNATGSGSIDVSNGASGSGCSVVGAGGGWKEAAGSYGLLTLVWLGLALRRRKPETGK